MAVLVYAHCFYFLVFLIIFRCLPFRMYFKVTSSGLERSLCGIFVCLIVETKTDLVWASQGFAELRALHDKELNSITHVLVTATPLQTEEMRVSQWKTWRAQMCQVGSCIPGKPWTYQQILTYMLEVCTWLSLLVLGEKTGGKGETLSLTNQVLPIWDRLLEKLDLTSSVVPRHSSLTSASLPCNRLLY